MQAFSDCLWEKSKCEKISIYEFEFFFTFNVDLYGANSIKADLQTCNLQTSWFISYNLVNHFLIEFAPSKWQTKSTLNVKRFHIRKWISSHISTFHIIEEMLFDTES